MVSGWWVGSEDSNLMMEMSVEGEERIGCDGRREDDV